MNDMEIVIGREEGARRLHCTVDGREFFVGQAGCVPSSVSRQHCKITINGNAMSVENLKPQNITYVDGSQIFSKSITANSLVQLGNEKYSVPLQQVIQFATGNSGAGAAKNAEQKQVPTFSLKPLESVWKEYDRRKMEIQNEAAKFANRQRLQGIVSMLGMLVGLIGALGPLRYVLMAIALALGIYFLYKGSKNATVQQQLHDLDEEFATKYKCPNPECGKPFGSVPYRMIEHNKQCFSCGCKYTH